MPSRADFEEMAGRAFRVGASDQALILRTVEPLGPSARKGGGFRLEFTGPGYLDQATYTLESDDVRVDIFIVPVAVEGESVIFEAIFN